MRITLDHVPNYVKSDPLWKGSGLEVELRFLRFGMTEQEIINWLTDYVERKRKLPDLTKGEKRNIETYEKWLKEIHD